MMVDGDVPTRLAAISKPIIAIPGTAISSTFFSVGRCCSETTESSSRHDDDCRNVRGHCPRIAPGQPVRYPTPTQASTNQRRQAPWHAGQATPTTHQHTPDLAWEPDRGLLRPRAKRAGRAAVRIPTRPDTITLPLPERASQTTHPGPAHHTRRRPIPGRRPAYRGAVTKPAQIARRTRHDRRGFDESPRTRRETGPPGTAPGPPG